jgi:hypothetical protein
MERTESTVVQQKEVKKTLKPATFVKLGELNPDIVSKIKKYPVKFVKTFAKSGREQVSILVNIHDKYLKQLNLRDGGPKNFLTAEFFNLISLEVNLELTDKKGRDLTEWNRNVPVRFVKGSYTNLEGEYRSVEVIFKKGLYITHFLNYDQTRLLENLEAKGLVSIEWETRPDAITKESESEDIQF